MQQFGGRMASGQMAPTLRATSALFDVGATTAASPRDLALVVRIERVACADEAAGVELYARGADIKPKELERAATATISTAL